MRQGHIRRKPIRNSWIVPLNAEPSTSSSQRAATSNRSRILRARGSLSEVGSGTEVTVRTLLKVAGLDPDKASAENLGLSDTAGAFADKNIDAALR
jgi:hypothetical protein